MDYEAKFGFRRESKQKGEKGDASLPPQRIEYAFLLNMLTDAMKYNADKIGILIMIPQYYRLYFNPDQRKLRIGYEEKVKSELLRELREHRKQISQSDTRPLVLEFDDDEELSFFQVGVTAEMVAPKELVDELPEVSGLEQTEGEAAGIAAGQAQSGQEPSTGTGPIDTGKVIEVEDEEDNEPESQVAGEAMTGEDDNAQDGNGIAGVEKPGADVSQTEAEADYDSSAVMVTVFEQGTQLTRCKVMENSSILIGRGPDKNPDIELEEDPERKLSGAHLRIINNKGEISLKVLGKNGIYIDKEFHKEGSTFDVESGVIVHLVRSKYYSVKITGGSHA